KCRRNEQIYTPQMEAPFKSLDDDAVFRQVTCRQRKACQGQRCYGHADKRRGEIAPETAHIAEVLWVNIQLVGSLKVCHLMNDSARCEEEKTFEKCMCRKVEHSCIPGTDTYPHHHKTKLRNR